MNSIIKSVGVLIAQGKKVLLVKHGKNAAHVPGVYGFPAGRVEEGESEKQAAVRELFEETGLQTTEEGLFFYPSNHYTNVPVLRKDGNTQVFDFKVFVCRNFTGQLHGTDEVIPEWVDIAKLDEYDLLPNVKEAVMREVKW